MARRGRREAKAVSAGSGAKRDDPTRHARSVILVVTPAKAGVQRNSLRPTGSATKWTSSPRTPGPEQQLDSGLRRNDGELSVACHGPPRKAGGKAVSAGSGAKRDDPTRHTRSVILVVTPAKAGVQTRRWIPACAGMTAG
jgi:hypothetical protein